MNDNNILHIYTDGACKGNPGIGGWVRCSAMARTRKR